MHDLSQIKVYDIIRDSFENMAFLDVSADQSSPGGALEDLAQIFCVKYSFPEKGMFMLLLPKSIKFQLAENIYGVDLNDLLPNQIDDSLLEILNVIGGRLLLDLFGKNQRTVLGLPYVSFDQLELPAGVEKSVYGFHVDELRFQFIWVRGDV